MNWEMVSAICAVVFAVGTVFNWWVMSSIRMEISKLKLDISEGRSADREELKEWTEERFMRRQEAIERMQGFERQLEARR